MEFPTDIVALAEEVIDGARARQLRITCAESCTGGLLCAALTHIAGASDIFDAGFVTYSNQIKTDVLGVPPDKLATHGAVSGEVAEAMAIGARLKAKADIALSITGIAGPGGGSAEKPVGLVYMAVTDATGRVNIVRHQFADIGRSAIREQAVRAALGHLKAALSS